MKKTRIISAALIAALITSFSACGASTGPHSSPTTEAATKSGDSSVRGKEDGVTNGGAVVGDSVSGERADGGADSASYETAPVTTVAPSFAKEEAFAADYDAGDYSYADSFDSAADFREPESERSLITNQARAGLLTGGEWRDNSNFTFWKKLFEHRSDWADVAEEYDLDTRSRIAVRIKDSNGNPAAGLTVKLADGSKTLLWENVTDSRGEAFLFPTLLHDDEKTVPKEIIAETPDGRAVIAEVPENYRDTDVAVEMTVPDNFPMRDKLDLMLMVDTTGSMGDELRYLQTELENVINRVVDNTQANVMLSVNFYRDKGDDYVVRDFGFTDRISIALDHLEDQRSGGGGDYPEAVTTALDNGINKHDWRSDSEKIMLLVLDAPPHKSDALQYLKPLIQSAAKLGIRIIPVASSGVDTDTEFLCRCMAMATGGTYTFLTDDSGVGYSHLEPTIGNYEVEKLNDMLVRIITDYFSQEARRTAQDSVYPDDEQEQEQETVGGRFPAAYTYTHDYFDGEGYYTTGIIRSEEELAAFEEKYGFDFEGYAEGLDFRTSALAYKVDMFGSGSISIDTSKGVYATMENGKPVFHYELDIPEVGTADILTVFVYAIVVN